MLYWPRLLADVLLLQKSSTAVHQVNNHVSMRQCFAIKWNMVALKCFLGMFKVFLERCIAVFACRPNSIEWMYIYPQQVANENKIKKNSSLAPRTEKRGRCKLDESVIHSPLWSCTRLQFRLNVASQSLLLVWGHFGRWKLLRKAASKGKVGSLWTLLTLILCTATPPLKQINFFQREGEAVHSLPPPKNLWRGQLQLCILWPFLLMTVFVLCFL